jgi:hypothetical protein
MDSASRPPRSSSLHGGRGASPSALNQVVTICWSLSNTVSASHQLLPVTAEIEGTEYRTLGHFRVTHRSDITSSTSHERPNRCKSLTISGYGSVSAPRWQE